MAKLSRKKGITSQILHVFIQDSSATTGAGLTGLVFNSASLACRYINAGGVLSGAITLQDITTLGTYEAPTANTNMRFKEVSSASPSQGMYELHIHNDWMNLPGGSLVIMLAGAANMAQTRLEIDLQADANVTHWLGTAAATPTVAGVPEVDVTHVGGTVQTAGDIIARLPAALVAGRMDSSVGAVVDGVLTAAKFAAGAFDAVWTVAARVLTAGTNIALAKGTGVTGFNDPSSTDNADALLKRDLSAVTGEAARSPLNALRFLRNKWAIAAGTLTVRKEDDATTAWTAAVTTAAGNPVDSIDPT